MRRWTALVCVMTSTASLSLGGPVAAPYEIGTWRGFRPAAITYTFDDDLPNQYAVAVPIFNARGFKLTLFTVPAWLPGGSWEPAQNAAAHGHEIASHTSTHPRLPELSAAQQTTELANSQAAINAHVTNQLCVTLAYPFCVKGDDTLTRQFYVAARGCSGQLVPATPPDFLNISSFVCGTEGSVKTPEDFNKLADRAAAGNAWCAYLIHAIDGDDGYSAGIRSPGCNVVSIAICGSGLPRTSHLHLGDHSMSQPATDREHRSGDIQHPARQSRRRSAGTSRVAIRFRRRLATT